VNAQQQGPSESATYERRVIAIAVLLATAPTWLKENQVSQGERTSTRRVTEKALKQRLIGGVMGTAESTRADRDGLSRDRLPK